MSDFRPVIRRLWMYLLPGLTSEVLLDVAADMRIKPYAKLNELTEEQWEEWYEGCATRCGVDPEVFRREGGAA
jgi:hypothetical protein